MNGIAALLGVTVILRILNRRRRSVPTEGDVTFSSFSSDRPLTHHQSEKTKN
jgi:hypothetical protein